MSVSPRPSMRTLSLEHPLADQLLGDRAERVADLGAAAGELLGRAARSTVGLDLVGAVVALLLAGDGQRVGQPAARGGLVTAVEDVVLVGREHREVGDRLGGLGGQLLLRLAQRRRNGLAASRPSATTSSVGAVAPPPISSMVFAVASASTIMIATSSPAMTPAGDDHVEDGLLQLRVGRERDPLGPSISATRTPATGPENGSPEIWVDADAALIASTSYSSSGFSAMTVMTTWTSLRRPALKVGRSGRSISRQVRMASSDGRPSRRKNEPGMRPGGVHPLLDVDGQREEVELLLRVLAGAWWRSAAWCPRRGTPRRSRRPAGPAVRSRSGWCGCRTRRCP